MTSRRDVLRGAATTAAASVLLEGCHTPPAASTPATVVGAPGPKLPGGLEVRGARFFRDGRPFVINGVNHWSALPLSRDGNTAGWDRLRHDLDTLQSLGVNTLRILGASEGPDSEPWRIVPALQPAAGRYDAASVTGLLRLVAELETRQLLAIVMMNNFWHWSGGMAQYLAWAGAGPVPYPPPAPGGSWSRYQRYTAAFYSNDRAKALYLALLDHVVPQLRSSPAVTWELANEPRGIDNTGPFHRWIDETAAHIKALAPSHLVTTGSEGQTPSPSSAGTDLGRDHDSPHIDFATFHLWAQNWGWIRTDNLERGLPKALELARAYIDDHVARATRLGKPLLLEEFGFPRDGGSFDPDAPTTARDRYFAAIYAQVRGLLGTTPLGGIMPWAWSGDARPPRPGAYWQPGDPFTGDPPHEQQGWYGLYTKDSTLRLVREFASARIS